MINVRDMLSRAEAVISAVEQKSPELIDAMCHWLEVVRDDLEELKTHIPKPRQAGDETDHAPEANDLLTRCHACHETLIAHYSSGPHNPKGFGLPGNPLLTLAFQFLMQWLQAVATQPAQQGPTPPQSE